MSRPTSDQPDSNRADLSKWDIKELNLSSKDPLLSDGITLLVQDPEFQKWLDLLKANDRRAAKIFTKDTERGSFAIKISTFFVSPRALHLHLALDHGMVNFRHWLDDRAKTAT